MYQKLRHGAMKHDKPLTRNTKNETRVMNPPFGSKNDFDFRVRLVEEIIPSDSIV